MTDRAGTATSPPDVPPAVLLAAAEAFTASPVAASPRSPVGGEFYTAQALARHPAFTAAVETAYHLGRDTAGPDREHLGQVRTALAEALATFTVHGHPGVAAVRTGWLDPARVQRWRSTLVRAGDDQRRDSLAEKGTRP